MGRGERRERGEVDKERERSERKIDRRTKCGYHSYPLPLLCDLHSLLK